MSRILRRLVPSPAMVVALIALVLSLGGSAYAIVITGKSIRNGTVTNKDIRNRSLTGSDVRRDKLGGGSIKESSLGQVPTAGLAVSAAGVDMWAVVNNDGVLVRSKNAAAGDPAAKTSDGTYQVIFNRAVNTCSYTATLGGPSTGLPADGLVSVTSLPANANGVRVRTSNLQGAPADRPFHLAVFC
jgi:hypothetical protein